MSRQQLWEQQSRLDTARSSAAAESEAAAASVRRVGGQHASNFRPWILYYIPGQQASVLACEMANRMQDLIWMQNGKAIPKEKRPPWLRGAPTLVDTAENRAYNGTVALQRLKQLQEVHEKSVKPTSFGAHSHPPEDDGIAAYAGHTSMGHASRGISTYAEVPPSSGAVGGGGAGADDSRYSPSNSKVSEQDLQRFNVTRGGNMQQQQQQQARPQAAAAQAAMG